MSLAIKYETVHDAQMRLRHSIVLYKGEPVYIHEIQQGTGKDDIFRVLFDPLPLTGAVQIARLPQFARDPFADAAVPPQPPAEKPERKYISSKYFDIAPFKLGYVNAKPGAFYCSRMPGRLQKQGLCGENFAAKDNFGRVVSYQTFLTCPDTPDMVMGKYPSFDKAIELLKKSPAVAFAREFCLVKDEVIPDLIYLYYKGAKVGMFNKNEVTLGTKFTCLKERLNEMNLKVGAF